MSRTIADTNKKQLSKTASLRATSTASATWRPNSTGRHFFGTADANSPLRLLSPPSPRARKLADAVYSPARKTPEFTKVCEAPFVSSVGRATEKRATSFAANKTHYEVFSWLSPRAVLTATGKKD
eukprot:TRINITY_DN369_c0_g1_i2.p3 TRINITY_DN369_c0_g1~~TRINITY_DN369_c0_g1_i2.p3  ORF type:complete len:125 (-),score=31.26 TRINITY_DN369_c0_g1_i2:145-519(-)